ncbi:reverse transcriptase domain-containing protein [Tanacetum coccineum]
MTGIGAVKYTQTVDACQQLRKCGKQSKGYNKVFLGNSHGIQCFNCKEFGHYAKECRKPKRVKDSTYHKEKMLLCKQAEKGVQLQARAI